MAIRYPTESEEAKVLVAYLRIRNYKFAHIPNETGHTQEAIRRAVRVKREGGSPGFPDYLIIKDNKLVVIELKRVKGSRTSPEQREWLAALADCGLDCAVCNGAQEAIDYLESI